MIESAAKPTAGSRSAKKPPSCLSRSSPVQRSPDGVEPLLDDRRGDDRDHAAVDDEDLAGDPLGRRRREVGDERRDVVGRVGVDGAAGRVLAEHLGGHRGAGARADRVGADADARQTAGGGQGQRGDAGLGGGVVGLPRRAAEERLGGGVDDAAVDRRAGLLRLAAPVRRRVAAQQEVAAQVDRDHGVPLLVGHVEEHPVTRHAGVVDDDVEPAVPVDGGGDHRVGGRPLADVAGHDRGLAAAAADLLRRLVARAGQVVDDDPGAGVGEGQRLGATQPGSGAGDDRDLAVEAGAHSSSSTSADGGPRAGRDGLPHPLLVLRRHLVGVELQEVVVVELEHVRGECLAHRVRLAEVEVDLDLHVVSPHTILRWSQVATCSGWMITADALLRLLLDGLATEVAQRLERLRGDHPGGDLATPIE